MTANLLIEKINEAKSLKDIFSNLDDWKPIYRGYVKLLHPDKCSLDGCEEAFKKLDTFKKQLTKGITVPSDAGKLVCKHSQIILHGKENLLKKSFDNLTILLKTNSHFCEFLPLRVSEVPKNDDKEKLTLFTTTRSVPLSYLGKQPIEHVNWIYSRLLSFLCWMHSIGYCHLGINPDTVMVRPSDHGIYIPSFFHMTKRKGIVTTISAKYKHFYPASLFKNKLSLQMVDIQLAKATAIHLLGDKTGNGSILRKDCPAELVDYLQSQERVSYDSYKWFRDWIKKNFETKFHILNV